MVYEAIARNPGLRLPAIRNICGLKDSTVDNAIKALRKKVLIKYAGTKKRVVIIYVKCFINIRPLNEYNK